MSAPRGREATKSSTPNRTRTRSTSSSAEVLPMWEATVADLGAPVFEPHGEESPYRYQWPA